jgi:predicted secreted protein
MAIIPDYPFFNKLSDSSGRMDQLAAGKQQQDIDTGESIYYDDDETDIYIEAECWANWRQKYYGH